MTKCVPVSDIDSIYSSLKNQTSRYQNLFDGFKKNYGCEANIISRAPGRVNLIGEHIDYMGYAVLPMSIDYDTLVAISFVQDSKNEICIKNTDEENFPSKTVSVEDDGIVRIDRNAHHWTNYVLCGVKGALEHAKIKLHGRLLMFIDGIVPIGAGLSSSSALACSTLLATFEIFGVSVQRELMASVAASCERFTGVEGGGMDQAISFMGEKGFAKLVNFEPISTKSVEIPQGYVFVVADSNVTSNKKETAEINYNMRVIECRLGSAVISKLNGLEYKYPKTHKLLQKEMGKSLEEMCEVVEKCLNKQPYTYQDIAKILELSKEEILENYFSSSSGGKLKTTGDSFKLFQRCYHVFSEANRVELFAKSNDPIFLGKLMDQSHFSLCDLYEASCPELESLTDICRNAGAVGSRLTGAGWGGATVSLVKEGDVDDFIQIVKEKFYKRDVGSETIFASKPSSGATIYKK